MLLQLETVEFLERLSSASPTPGGGGASATVGALSAALGLMVANLTVGKKNYEAVDEQARLIRGQLIGCRDRLVELTDRDAEAFAPVAKAYKLPKTTEEERKIKEEVMEQALVGASMVPMEMMETILVVMRLLEEMGTIGSRMAITDVGTGILFAQAALEGASLNVYINTNAMKNKETADQMAQKAKTLIQEGLEIRERTYQYVLEHM